ncbi:MAG TPA: hypothetical protein VLC55_02915 [Burkholderiales bacterium]|nr:hypothetical protein [Burkholderiales bacterium]
MGMEDPQAATDARGNTPEAAGPSTAQPAKKRVSMHDGIAVWADCCSCAAEPYWLAVAEEMGIDLGSDYEDEDAESP